MVNNMTNELTKVIQDSSIAPTQAEFLLENFKYIFETAKDLEIKARAIKVTEITQVKEMQDAKNLRIEIKNLRCEANNKREKLKEESLRTGKAIQGFYNVIEALTKPLESYLEEQEKFAERLEEQKKNDKFIERSNLLSKFVEDTSLYNLREMSEQGFQELLRTSELSKKAIAEAEKREQEEKEEKERKEKREQEKMRLENARLKKILEDKRIKEEEARRKAKIESDKKQAEINKANADKKALEDKIAADKKAKEDKEAEIKENERKAGLAPDKEKLALLSKELSLYELPELQSEEAKKIIIQVKDLLSKISIYIIKNSNNL